MKVKPKFRDLVGWQPFPAIDGVGLSSQELAIAFSQDDENKIDFLLLEGGRGNGKSACGLYMFFQFVGQGYEEKWNGLVLRPQFGALKSIFNLAVEMCEKLFQEDEYTLLNSNDSKMIKFKTGEFLEFNYLSNEKEFELKYKGSERPFVLVEELTTFDGLMVLAKIRTTLRSSVAKNGKMPPIMLRATTNPTGTKKGHQEVKEQIIYRSKPGEILELEMEHPFKKGVKLKSTQMYIKTNFLENPHLPDDYLTQFIQLKETNYKHYLMEVVGLWDVQQDGMLYSDVYDEEKVILPEFKIPSLPIFRAFDYGSHDPFCMLYYITLTKSTACLINNRYSYFPNNTIIIIDEIYGAKSIEKINEGLNISDIELVKLIKEKESKLKMKFGTVIKPGPCDDILKRGEKAGNRTKYDYFKENGIIFNKAIKKAGSVEVGCDLISESLYSVKYELEEPRLYITKNCKFLIASMFNLEPDEVNPKVPKEGQSDHGNDVVRYIKLEKSSKSKTIPL